MVSNDFQFGSQRLSDYQMFMCAPEDGQEFVTRTVNRGEITSVRPRPNHYGITYDDALILNFFIMKESGCYKQEDFKMTGDELHYIRTWLESPKTPTELIVPFEDDELTTYYYGVFTSIQPYIIDEDCYGLVLEFTCDSPYGYSEEQVLEYEVDSSGETITDTYVNISAEQYEYLKPVVVVSSSSTFGSDESVSIKNTSDNDNTMTVTLPKGLSGITIDCNKKVVTDSDGNLVPFSDIGIVEPVSGEYNFISTDSFLFYWLSFIGGDNDIEITPSSTNTISTIEIKVRVIIKSGGF